MNRRINGVAKPGFASRPVRVGLAMKIAFAILAANAGFAAAKALRVKAPQPQPARVVAGQSVRPFILPIDWAEPAAVAQSDRAQDCRGLADPACHNAL
ncbi:MAG: hypothetical protein ACR65U_06645 [Methylocystis sp.]